MPSSLVHDCINHGLPLYICDGVDECIKAVRVQIRRGAKVRKLLVYPLLPNILTYLGHKSLRDWGVMTVLLSPSNEISVLLSGPTLTENFSLLG